MDVLQVVKALRVHKPGAVPSVVSSSAAHIVGGLYHYKSQTLPSSIDLRVVTFAQRKVDWSKSV